MAQVVRCGVSFLKWQVLPDISSAPSAPPNLSSPLQRFGTHHFGQDKTKERRTSRSDDKEEGSLPVIIKKKKKGHHLKIKGLKPVLTNLGPDPRRCAQSEIGALVYAQEAFRLDNTLREVRDNLSKDARRHARMNCFMQVRKRDMTAQLQSMRLTGAALLFGVSVLQNVEDGARRQVELLLERRKFAAGDKVVAKGQDGFFVLVHGVAVVDGERGAPGVNATHRTLEYRAPGDHFGELTVLYDVQHPVDVIAKTDLECLHFNREKLASGKVPDEALERMRRNARTLFVAGVDLLASTLGSDELALIANALVEEFYEPGEVICRQGSEDHTFYILSKGTVAVTKSSAVLRAPIDDPHAYDVVYHYTRPGEYFGELAVLYDLRRQASVIAKEHVHVLMLSQATLRMLVDDVTLEKLRVTARAMFLKGVPLIAATTTSVEQQQLLTALQSRSFGQYEKVCRSGSIGDKLYILEQGECVAVKNGATVAAYRTPGAYFGDLAVLYDIPRQANILVESQNVRVLTLSRADLFRILPESTVELMHRFAERMFITSVPVLQQALLDEGMLDQLLDRFQRRTYEAETTILTRGGQCDMILIFQSGEIQVDGVPQLCMPGTFFGEDSIVQGQQAMHSVMALTKVHCMAISAVELFAIVPRKRYMEARNAVLHLSGAAPTPEAPPEFILRRRVSGAGGDIDLSLATGFDAATRSPTDGAQVMCREPSKSQPIPGNLVEKPDSRSPSPDPR